MLFLPSPPYVLFSFLYHFVLKQRDIFSTCWEVVIVCKFVILNDHKTFIISGIATNVPKELPRFVKTTTNKIRVILFRQKPFIVLISSGNLSKSLTLGFRESASTRPETHPAAIMGFKEVRGAANTDDKIVNGCANAITAPMPAKMPFAMTHQVIISDPALVPP